MSTNVASTSADSVMGCLVVQSQMISLVENLKSAGTIIVLLYINIYEINQTQFSNVNNATKLLPVNFASYQLVKLYFEC